MVESKARAVLSPHIGTHPTNAPQMHYKLSKCILENTLKMTNPFRTCFKARLAVWHRTNKKRNCNAFCQRDSLGATRGKVRTDQYLTNVHLARGLNAHHRNPFSFWHFGKDSRWYSKLWTNTFCLSPNQYQVGLL